MIFSKTTGEIIPSRKPKNLETIPSKSVCQRKISKNSGVLYIVKNVIKNAIR